MSYSQHHSEGPAASVYPMAGKDPGEDRRAHRRTPVKGSIPAVVYRTQGLPITAQVRDLSRGGIGLSAAVAIRRDEQFTVTVNLGNGLLTLHCRVANCRLVDDRYFVGGQFVTIERYEKCDRADSDSGQHVINAVDFIDPMDPLSPDGLQHVRDVEQRLREAMEG